MSDELEKKDFSRRTFIGGAAVAGVALAACAQPAKEATVSLGPKMTLGPELAPDGEPIKAGVIGCGGRGTGAAGNFLSAGPNLEIVALADTFSDRIDNCRARLKKQFEAEIADDMCYTGFDAYKKLLENEDINYVIIATPPYYRPEQFAAAVEARKNVFMEKPACVDPVGARSIMETAEKATALNLKVATGTQRRHQKNYIETYNQIMDGAIGPITAARAYWNQSQLWFKERQKGWSDMEWMIRDWVNWCWLSGDHIVEQHVHNVDVINWFTDSHPVNAVGMGARARRVTGDQYDFFAVDYEMENGIHMMSMCRQVDGCENNVSEYVVGTKGSSNCRDTIYDLDGNITWKYEPAKDEAGNDTDTSPYVQEHIDLVTHIREDKPINEARNTAVSTLTAVMGRTSAYTGKKVTWDEMMSSDTTLGPDEMKLGSYPDFVKDPAIPVPGEAKKED